MIDKKKSWILLYRSLQEHWLWKDKPFARGQAWLDLIMLANHKDAPFYDGKGKIIQGKRGTVYKSIQYLAERWGWSRGKVDRFLNTLCAEGMIIVEKKRACERTSIIIVNYGVFQSTQTSERTSNGHVTDKGRTCDGQGTDIYKECIKNDKECRKKKEEPSEQRFMTEEEWEAMPGEVIS